MIVALTRLDSAIRAGLVTLNGRRLIWAALIACLAALTLIPGQSGLPITDRDEARYVTASKQMLETGDFINPQNLDKPRWKKPAGIYWLQSLGASATGQGAEAPNWAYRLPSSLGILLAGLLTMWAVAPVAGASAAGIAGIIVVTSFLTVFEGHIAKTDAALLAAITLTQGALIRCLRTPAAARFGRYHALFWAALSLGVLIKGPIILIVTGGTLLWLTIAKRSLAPLRSLKLWPGLALFALLTAPWFIAIGIVTDGGFYAESVGKDLAGKVGNAAEGHSGPPGYYLGLMWVTLWPWAVLLPLAAGWAWRSRREEALILAAAWVIPMWLVFEIVSTKLPHYILPALPALAMISAMWLISPAAERRSNIGLRLVVTVLFLLGAVVMCGLTAYAPMHFEGQWAALPLIAAIAGFMVALLAALALVLARPHAFAGLALLSGLLVFPVLFGSTLPGLRSLFLSPPLAAAHLKYQPCAPQPVRATGYIELSLAIIAGTDTRFISPDQAAELLATGPDGTRVLVQTTDPATLPDLESRAGTPLEKIETVTGIAYNVNDKRREYGLIARKDDPVLRECR